MFSLFLQVTRGPVRPCTLFLRANDYCSVELDSSLQIEDFDGLAILMHHYKRDAMYLRPLAIESDNVDAFVDHHMKLFFDIWLTSGSSIPKCVPLLEKYDEHEQWMLTQRCVPEILDSRAKETNTITCEVCGKLFPYTTGNERGNYKLHIDFHKYESAQCGCSIVFKSKKEAKRHHLLHHSKRDYVKCSQCHVVVQSKYLERHEREFHKDFICNDCGKVGQLLVIEI